MKDALSSIQQFIAKRINVTCLLVTAIVLAIDYISGRAIRFPITYVLPVGMAAWHEKRAMAYAIAIFMPLARVGFHFPWNELELISVALINACITVLALSFYAYLVDRVAWQKRALEKKVQVLEGILPVCASCKKIRNPRGEYEPMEKYIMERSTASVSHTVCPECNRKLYPEYFNDKGIVS